MTLAYYGADMTPPTLSDCMGTAACPFAWEAGATCSSGNATWIGRFPFSWTRLDTELNQNGRPVLIGMHMQSNVNDTHWVLATSGQGSAPGNYLVNDPYPEYGETTNLAVLARQGYVFDSLAVYDGEPVCNALGEGGYSTSSSLALLEPSALGWGEVSEEAAISSGFAVEPLSITGAVSIYHVELTAVIVRLSATSNAGAITEQLLWTDSNPTTTWRPFSTLSWTPWQPNDRVHVRFRDAAGNVSQDYTTSIRPVHSPPPLPPARYLNWMPEIRVQ